MDTSSLELRDIPARATQFVALREALRTRAYEDAGKKVWTIGFGHTGPDVKPGLVWTEEQALAALASDMNSARSRIYHVLGADVVAALNDNQYCALLSFVYNEGLNPQWNITRRLIGNDWVAVAGEMRRFVYSGGQHLKGLENRRHDEIILWNTPV